MNENIITFRLWWLAMSMNYSMSVYISSEKKQKVQVLLAKQKINSHVLCFNIYKQKPEQLKRLLLLINFKL